MKACLATLLILLPACAGSTRGPRLSAVPAAAMANGAEPAAAPVFQKVPPEENTAVVQVPPTESGLAGGGPYRLEIEDKLDISIYGEADLQHVEVPVRPDGMISFAFIGDVLAAGRTVEEVRGEITERLGQYLRSPQVTVIAKEFAQKKVYLGGEVKNPGVLYLGGREGTLLDALYKAGLNTDRADLRGAYVMRATKILDTDFGELIRGNVSQNIRLADQDIIYVPENAQRYVYVLGEVRRNDALEVRYPIPMVEVIARAGGLEEFAKKREIAVIRGGLKTPEIAIVNVHRLLKGDLQQNIMVKPGDIVYVATSALGKYLNFIDALLRSIAPIVQGTIVYREYDILRDRGDPDPSN